MSRKAWGILGAIAGVLLLLFALSSCGDRRQEVGYVTAPSVVQPAPQVVAAAPAAAPVVVQQAPSHDGLLTGMLLGHMLGQSSAPHYAPPAPAYAQQAYAPSRTVINRTTIINQAPAAAPAPTPVAKSGAGIEGVVPAVLKPATPPAASAPPKQAAVPAPRVTAVAGAYSAKPAYASTTYRSSYTPTAFRAGRR